MMYTICYLTTLQKNTTVYNTYWIRLLNCCSVSKDDRVSRSRILSFSISRVCAMWPLCTFARSLECVVTLMKEIN